VVQLTLWTASFYNDDSSFSSGTNTSGNKTAPPPITSSAFLYSRWLGIFTGFPSQTTAYPSDFNPYDFSNAYQILFPGWFGNPAISYAQYFTFGSSTADISFPIAEFRAMQDVVQGSSFSISVTSQALNKVVNVSKENSTFPLGSLFAALLSIVNISLTVYALIFPTTPMVVSQTYFRFKEPHKFDPTKDLSPGTPNLSASARQVELERLASPSVADTKSTTTLEDK